MTKKDDRETTHAPEEASGRPPALPKLRKQIDEIDQQIVELLGRRARCVAQVGKAKHRSGTPIYAPHREAEVLKRVLSMNKGPLPARALEAIYRELMSGSFAIEQPLRVGFLGPKGTFSHVAAVSHFGSSVELDALIDIRSVFAEVQRGHMDYGLVPIENSTGGGISETLDAFSETRQQVFVYAEVLVAIRHHLISNTQKDQVKKIYSKPEVFAQCRNWLGAHYPEAELIPAASTSHAVRHVRRKLEEDTDAGVAAIGSALASKLYGTNILFRDIEDNSNNITRFCVLAKERAQPSGHDKTSVMFTTNNEPGALVSVLNEFHQAGINLTHIDKRPSRRENWTYSFFVDAEGHQTDPVMYKALERIKVHCKDLVVLGSYPRAERIL